LTPGKFLFIPAYWWYSFKFAENTSVSSFKYRTYMNNIAISPHIFMYALQNQNVERKTAKQIDIKNLNQVEGERQQGERQQGERQQGERQQGENDSNTTNINQLINPNSLGNHISDANVISDANLIIDTNVINDTITNVI